MFKKLCLTAAMVAAAATSFAGDLVINGSTTVLPVVQKATEAFAKTNPDVHIALSGGGSGNGVKALIDGLTNIAMSSRDIKASEVKLAEQRGVKPYRTAVAVDAIVPVVNNANTVKDLTQEQLKAVFEGKIRNWKEVGGEDLKIQVINRDEASGTREAFRTIVMDGTPFDRRSAVLSGTGQVRDVVSRSRGAIGYISLGFVDSLNAKTSVKAASVNHVEASEKTVASGGYPISRDLYFFVKGAPSQQAQDYIDYVTSEKMDKQIREAGFIPVTNDEKGSE